MVFEHLCDFGERQLSSLALDLVEVGISESVCLVSCVLILRKNISPQFLVLSHELKDTFAIPLFFICHVDIDNLLGFKGQTKAVFYLLVGLTQNSELVILAEGSILDTELFLSLFNLDPGSLLAVCRCLSKFFFFGLFLLLTIFL